MVDPSFENQNDSLSEPEPFVENPPEQPNEAQPENLFERLEPGMNLFATQDEFFGLESNIDDIEKTARFIELLKNATLEDSNMDPEAISRIRHASPEFPFNVDDPDFLFALRSFFACNNASQDTYNSFRAAAIARHPDDDFLSYDQVKHRIEQISGVTPILHDMCINSCCAFTGPFRDHTECTICAEPRYEYKSGRHGRNERCPRRQFHTIPIGPVLQALYRSPDSAKNMHHRKERTREICSQIARNAGKIKIDVYDDIYVGSDYIKAVLETRIQDNDIVLEISIDGAQLLRNKPSDCWIYIFIIHNLPANLRYKKRFVIPGGFIPGPQKPKHLVSFLFPGLFHLSALQNEGLSIWDSSCALRMNKVIPFLAFVTADSPAMASVSAMVGHQGKYGCRLHCGLPGRRRHGEGHYYPVMLKPPNFTVEGCNHDNVSFCDLYNFRVKIPERYQINLRRVCQSANTSQYKDNRLETGLCGPTIFSGLKASLGVPNMFVLDIMHLVSLNVPDLLLGLWRGTINCYGNDKHHNWPWLKLQKGPVWESHGKTVEMATKYLPSSFDRAPRNPAEKINSGYKAWEYLLYMFALGPALFKSILPELYFRNYCKLVRGVQILQQRSIPREQLVQATQLLHEFVHEFEELYYQRKTSRLHFVRQSIHLLTHIASEVTRAGPLACYAQWTMESAIGSLGDEIRQDQNPYANISQRGILRAQFNAIQSMITLSLKNESKLPSYSMDLGDGYALLTTCDNVSRKVSEGEAMAIMKLWDARGWPNLHGWTRKVKRWARLQIPNGQIARSVWGDGSSKKRRRTTIVKVCFILLHLQ